MTWRLQNSGKPAERGGTILLEREKDKEGGPIQAGTGKCMASGCSCPSYVDPPGGFDCRRCGHAKSEHW